jgi:threonine dehydrogenase-like Zn-dependent dehydrogenase
LTARELWFTAPRSVECRTGSVPAVGTGQLLLRGIASGVSQGTELLLYRGEGPIPFDPSLPDAETYPCRYGYAWVGRVMEGEGLPAGARVFALAPHGDWHLRDSASVRPIPDGVPASRAVLAANLETAINVTWDAGAGLGDEVVVLGAGVVGVLATWLCQRAGANVRVIEPSEHRRKLALTFGAAAAVRPEDDVPRANADVVIEATGDPSALERAIAHARVEARIVVASFYGRRTAPVALGNEFHRRRLSLRSSQVSSIPPSHAPRWSTARRFSLVESLLADSKLDILIDEVVPFDHAPAAYARMDRDPTAHMQLVFDYGSE